MTAPPSQKLAPDTPMVFSIRDGEPGGWDLFGWEVTRFWTARLGPAPIALARFSHYQATAVRESWLAAEVAGACGFGKSCSRLHDTFERLASRRHVEIDRSWSFVQVTVSAHWPAINERDRERIPAVLLSEMDQ